MSTWRRKVLGNVWDGWLAGTIAVVGDAAAPQGMRLLLRTLRGTISAMAIVPVGVTPSTVSASRRAGALHCVETRYVTDQTLPTHAHDTANIVLVLGGNFLKRAGSRRDDCAPGMVFFQPREQEHMNAFHGSGGRCLTFEIEREDCYGVTPPSQVVTSPLLAGLAARLDAEFRADDDVSRLAIEGLVMEVVAELARFEPRRDQTLLASAVQRAWELIRREPQDVAGLEDIAARVGAHPVSLARAFRRTFRMTIGEAIRRERVAVACGLLAGKLSIAEIAARSGFADQSHLARVFRRVMGFSPSRYRRSG
jgi:AraC family transcriptional regulator